MTEHFLTYEQSLAVKELRFNEPCIAMYFTKEPKYNYDIGELCYAEEGGFWDDFNSDDDRVSAPLKIQFFKWVREKYEYCIHITPHTENDGDDNFIIYQYEWEIIHPKYFDGTYHDTYEQAEDACINKIIELIKQK